MIIHTIISEYDVFRGQTVKKQTKPKPINPLITDPKRFINKKSRVN